MNFLFFTFRAEREGFIQLYGKIVQLKLLAADGKIRETDTANTEIIFRIIRPQKWVEGSQEMQDVS